MIFTMIYYIYPQKYEINLKKAKNVVKILLFYLFPSNSRKKSAFSQ